jgi:hypothetical protein
MTNKKLKKILKNHKRWLAGGGRGRADLRGANLCRANLCGADLRDADLRDANLCRANLRDANLCGADLCGADLSDADLSDAVLRGAVLRGAVLRDADLCRANLCRANLCGADLSDANLCGAVLRGAVLRDANLCRANLRDANLCGADLCGADLSDANLCGAKNMVKVVGVFPGNRYYKAISESLCNNGYTYTVGLNTLREGEVFASDDRVLCSSPGFHFASESWCRTYYGDRRYLCLIRIPTKEEYENTEINEPWATDGKASASAIIIEKVFDTKDGDKDVTDRFIGWADGKGNKTKG